MPRHVATLLTLSTLTLSSGSWVFAQAPRSAPTLVSQQASVLGGHIRGMVRDDAGHAVVGASIVALGATPLPVMARSDTLGQFSLALPPGEYILRATRDGYVSTYREPVRIQSSTLLERTITLVRQGAPPARRVVLAAAPGVTGIETLREEPENTSDSKETDHPHNEAAWRLRHLTPTALRDIAVPQGLSPAIESNAFRPRSSFVDWMMGQSARAATSFFANTNFSGQLNFLTTSSLATAGSWMPTQLPRGIAYAAVGAPVGTLGDWKLRGAMSAGMSSWAVVGEYAARDDRPHVFAVGLSYSSQLSENGSDATPAAINDRARSVGGMYAFDHWQIQPAFELTYGLRLDRYDYVAGSEFLSPQVGVRISLLPETRLTATASERAIAPGADEFLPPSAGPWLPPERTFAPLLPTGSFQAERVRNYEIGIEQQIGHVKTAPSVGVRRFRQSAENQVATLFGLDAGSDVGHYYVATPGGVDIDGWMVRATGRVTERIAGTIAYSVGEAAWRMGPDAAVIAKVAPSVVRPTDERMHDLTTSIDAKIPETATKVSLGYRVNTSFSRQGAAAMPFVHGRFDIELRQALPLHPTRGSNTELLLVVRNLFRDLGEAGSMYDELLTVAPPMRIMGGVQVRF
jgi:hypothetical protein